MITATLSAAVAVLVLAPTGAETEPDYDTPIGRAVAACELHETGSPESETDAPVAELMDDGHSVLIGGRSPIRAFYDGFGCVIDELGLPEWVWHRVQFTVEGMVDVGDYSIAWQGNEEAPHVFLIYDSEVGGGHC